MTLAQPAVMVPDEAPNDQPFYDETYQYDAIMSQQLWQPDVQFSGANVFTRIRQSDAGRSGRMGT